MTANLIADAQAQLEGIITAAYGRAFPDKELRSFNIEIPKDTSHGDFASNVAMISAKAVGKAPRDIAAALIAEMDFAGSYFSGAEAAGPGFLNFRLNGSWFSHAVKAVLDCGADYGRSDYGKGEKIMVEFVSANPTGPMHMGNARGGAIGDCLASALDFAGYDVTREFYINDAGNQIAKFGRSLEARYLQIYLGEDAVEFPEDGYQAEDIKVRGPGICRPARRPLCERPQRGAHPGAGGLCPARQCGGTAPGPGKVPHHLRCVVLGKEPARQRRRHGGGTAAQRPGHDL